MQTNGEGFEPWTLMSSVGVVQGQPRSCTRIGCDVVVTAGIVGLKRPPVSHEAEDHTDAAGVINPVAAHRVHQPEGLKAAGLERTNGVQRDMTVQHGIASGLHRRPRGSNQFTCYHSIHNAILHFVALFLEQANAAIGWCKGHRSPASVASRWMASSCPVFLELPCCYV